MDAYSSCVCSSLPYTPSSLFTPADPRSCSIKLSFLRCSSAYSSLPHDLNNDESPAPGIARRPLNPTTRRSSDEKHQNFQHNASKGSNPLRNFVGSSVVSEKLWLSSKISPPPPPPPPPPDPPQPIEEIKDDLGVEDDARREKRNGVSLDDKYREEGKIFVGNLPLWVKKKEVAEFFRQFGPLKNVVLIKGHDDPERNMGYCFVIYGGPTAANSASKAVEFDGVEFHGRVLTVKLDDGRRLKVRTAERSKWLDGSDSKDYRSKWHEERDHSCREFRRVLDTEPENWQAVVSSFQRIKKVAVVD